MPKLVDRPPADIPVEPAKFRIGCGVVMLVVAILLVVALGTYREPGDWGWSELLAESLGGYGLVAVLHRFLWIPVAILAITGFRLLFEGLARRNFKEVTCRACGRLVVAKKRHFGLLCPRDNGGHYARVYWGEVIAAILVLGSAAVLTFIALRAHGVL